MKKLTFECGEDLAKRIKMRATREDRSQQQLILAAIKAYMDKGSDELFP